MDNTNHFNLKKPDDTDYYNVQDFNENADIIDEALYEIQSTGNSNRTDIATHILDENNPHNVTKAQIGLSEVENKSSERIRSEITYNNVVSGLGYRPIAPTDTVDNGGVEREKLKFQVVHDTEANWETTDPILLTGEIGYDETNKVIKFGDGESNWSELKGVSFDEIYDAASAYTDQAIADLIGEAPQELDTIYELAEALADSQDLIDAIQVLLESKADKTLADNNNNGLMSSAEYVKLEHLTQGFDTIKSQWYRELPEGALPNPDNDYRTGDFTPITNAYNMKINSLDPDDNKQYFLVSDNLNVQVGRIDWGGIGYDAHGSYFIKDTDYPAIRFNMTVNGILSTLDAPTSGEYLLTNSGNWITPASMTASDFVGATAQTDGVAGLVPAPLASANLQYVANDGTWHNFYDDVDNFNDVDSVLHGFMTPTDKIKLDGIERQANKYVHPVTNGYKHIPENGASGQILAWSSTGTAAWANPEDVVPGIEYDDATQSEHGLMSTTDKIKLDGIETGANNYTHPVTTGWRHIPTGGQDGQYLKWGADGLAIWSTPPGSGGSYDPATEDTDGLMSAADKTKLDHIENNANYYVHPTESGYKHIPSGGSSGKFLGWASDGTAQWVDAPEGTEYDDATQSEHGLMSAADKTKLDSVQANANYYEHPTTAGWKHIPTGGSAGQVLTYYASGTAAWADIPTASVVTEEEDGLMSSTDKVKLDGIEAGANNYTHPTEAGWKHIPTGGSAGQYLTYSASGTAVWANISVPNVTTSSNGLMLATDKVKLDGIAEGANYYVHPENTPHALGFYKVNVDNNGHVTNASLVAKSDITDLGIPGQDTTYDVMVGATEDDDGEVGLVPAPPSEGYESKFLRADGTWAGMSASILGGIVPINKGGTGANTLNGAKTNLQINNIDNTADLDKPISTATQTALNAKADQATTYTKTEVDNLLSTLETNIDWKEAVDTYNDIATTYPNPVDGWTVNVKDTDITYRYNGTDWIAISANAIPKATSALDGLMAKEDKAKLDGLPSSFTDTNTTYTFQATTGGFSVTPSEGSAQQVNVIPNDNVTGTGVSGCIAKFNDTNTVTNGPAFGSSTATFLRNDGTWAVPAGSGGGGAVSGVKGGAETDYRTGDVNITATNIGLGNVTNDRQVKGLASGTTNNHIVLFGSDGYTIKDSGYSISDLRALILGETVVTGTLAQGATTVTLLNNAITTSSYYKIYTSIFGVSPTAVTVSAGSMTLTFEAQNEPVSIEVRVENPT